MGCSGLVKAFLLIQKWSIRRSLKGGLDILLWGLTLACSSLVPHVLMGWGREYKDEKVRKLIGQDKDRPVSDERQSLTTSPKQTDTRSGSMQWPLCNITLPAALCSPPPLFFIT